jgi:hypothetical protein
MGDLKGTVAPAKAGGPVTVRAGAGATRVKPACANPLWGPSLRWDDGEFQ